MDDRYAIQLARTEIREGYRTGDVGRILDVYSDRFGDMSCGQPSFGGDEAKAVKRAQLKQMFAHFDVYSAPASIEILLLGDFAVDYGWQDLQLTPRDGRAALRYRTRFMSLWKRQAKGCWKIAILIDNQDEGPLLVSEMLARIESSTCQFSLRPSGIAAELCGEPSEQTLAEP